MAAADAFVMASRYEGFPNALMEAMAVGLPCIAVDCPSGPREITSDGCDAILICQNDQAALVDAMNQVMGDPTLRFSLGVKARKSVITRYSLISVLSAWDKAFIDVKVGA